MRGGHEGSGSDVWATDQSCYESPDSPHGLQKYLSLPTSSQHDSTRTGLKTRMTERKTSLTEPRLAHQSIPQQEGEFCLFYVLYHILYVFMYVYMYVYLAQGLLAAMRSRGKKHFCGIRTNDINTPNVQTPGSAHGVIDHSLCSYMILCSLR